MTPTDKVQLDEHVQAIAKILYADVDKSQMTNLAEIEAKCLRGSKHNMMR